MSLFGIGFRNKSKTVAVSATNPLPTTAGAGSSVDLGAKADTAATTDTGTFSLIALFKRLLQKLNVGATNVATNQVATSTTAGTLLAARATRRVAIIKNLDTSIIVYIGPATVTAANGMQLLPGQSIPVSWTGLIQVIAASGTPTVAYLEEYD